MTFLSLILSVSPSPSPTQTSAPVTQTFGSIPDIALGAIIGALVAGLVALIGHVLKAWADRQSRLWTSLWPKKAEAYEKLVEWSIHAGEQNTDTSVKLQTYASTKVRDHVAEYLEQKKAYEKIHGIDSLPKAKTTKMRLDLGELIRADLKSKKFLR